MQPPGETSPEFCIHLAMDLCSVIVAMYSWGSLGIYKHESTSKTIAANTLQQVAI